MKEVIDRMNAEKFIDVVNDPLFVGGLSKAIMMSRARNYETGFTMYRVPSEDETFFDETIEIGDSTSIGGYHRHGDLVAEFEEENGGCPNYPRPIDGIGVDKEKFFEVQKERFEYSKKLRQFLESKQEEFNVNFPNLPNARDKHFSYHFEDVYNLVGVHTHPIIESRIFGSYSPAFPSGADLKVLWGERDKALEEVIDEEMEFHKPRIVAPVFSMIAGTDSRDKVGDGNYQLGLVACHKDRISEREVVEATKQFSSLWKINRDRGFATNDAYSFTLGTFDPKKMSVQFEPSNIDAMMRDVE